MKIASAQILIVGGDQQGNLGRAKEAISTAKSRGADFVVLPECSNFGWTDSSALLGAVEISKDTFIAGIVQCAKAESIYVAVGFVERKGEHLYNSALLIDESGEIQIHHRKINELHFAKELYQTGSEVFSAETRFGTVGLMICADALSETEQVIERLVEKGVDIILSPSAWAVAPEHDNDLNPYGSLWIDAYRNGLKNSKTWIIATSNVGVIAEGVWQSHLCIGNSIASGPNHDELQISPFGKDAIHIEIIEVLGYS
jgi:predicted amidohydrolase